MANRASFKQDFRRFFFRGLATLLPTILTIVILVWIGNFLYFYISAPIHSGIRLAWANAIVDEKDSDHYRDVKRFVAQYVSAGQIPDDPVELYQLYVDYKYDRYYQLSILSIVTAILGIYFVGYLLATYVGRALWRAVEGSIMALPFVRKVYPYVKQFTDYVFSERKFSFSRAVLVEYPRREMWSIGFMTGKGLTDLNKHTREEMVTVYLPSAPTPFTGYTIVVPRKDIVEIDMSVDEILRWVVSLGVISPLRQTPPDLTPSVPRSALPPGILPPRPKDPSKPTGSS